MRVEKRTIKGSKIREKGLIPGVLYGKGIESVPIQATQEDFRKQYADSGYTKTFEIKLDGKKHIVYIKATQPSIKNIHVKQHFDLHKVSADDTMTTKVYVKFLNKEEVKKRGFVINPVLDEVEIEYPVGSGISNLELDLTGLVDKDIKKAGEIPLPKGITLLTDPESVVVSISEKIEYSLDDIESDEEEVREVESIKQSND